MKASKLETASEIVPLDDEPSEGSMVTVLDPEEHPISFDTWRSIGGELDLAQSKLIVNYEDEKLRKKKFQRFVEDPAAVYKVSIAHCRSYTRLTQCPARPLRPLRQ